MQHRDFPLTGLVAIRRPPTKRGQATTAPSRVERITGAILTDMKVLSGNPPRNGIAVTRTFNHLAAIMSIINTSWHFADLVGFPWNSIIYLIYNAYCKPTSIPKM
jgi:hypothetical protein